MMWGLLRRPCFTSTSTKPLKLAVGLQQARREQRGMFLFQLLEGKGGE
jgi:hypothetical protein